MWSFSRSPEKVPWMEENIFKLAILIDQGHISEVVAVQQASQRNPQSLYLLLNSSSMLELSVARVTSEKSLPFQSLCKVFLQQLNLLLHLVVHLLLLLQMLAQDWKFTEISLSFIRFSAGFLYQNEISSYIHDSWGTGACQHYLVALLSLLSQQARGTPVKSSLFRGRRKGIHDEFRAQTEIFPGYLHRPGSHQYSRSCFRVFVTFFNKKILQICQLFLKLVFFNVFSTFF